MNPDLRQVSRAISHALRHAPWLYELELDEQGWTPVEDLLSALRNERKGWRNLNEADLARMIETSTKRRFEIGNGRIRALYGHSIPDRLSKSPATPPEILYHGTAPEVLASIRESGLQPMRRQYVHLSTDEATAVQVGLRKAGQPVILRISAQQASGNGVRFYPGNEQVWLADHVPAEYIEGL
jgi:putative RNA 2'-phosphotransferase